MAELKMTGNCLRASRPLLSFDQNFTKDAHWQVMKELFTQIFGVPNQHPKSQPFFDHVFTFCVVDDKVINFFFFFVTYLFTLIVLYLIIFLILHLE